MEATIVFKNAVELTVEKNGESLILTQKPAFPEDLTGVQVISEEGTMVYENPKVVECASVDGRYWFSFVEKNKTEEKFEMLEEAIVELAELIGG